MMTHDLVKAEGNFPYNFTIPRNGGGLPQAHAIYDRLCTALRVHSECELDDGPPGGRPWAFKEPQLRYLLPVFEGLLGRTGFKLVHVTRDVRDIHSLHQDDQLADSFAETRGMAAEAIGRIAWSPLLQSLAGKGANGTDVTQEVVESVVRFQLVWAHVELAVRHLWQGSWPEGYFHLSELKMLRSGPATVRSLASFLGLEALRSDQVSRMMAVYKPQPANNSVGVEVSRLAGMESVLLALREFGYAA
jgi:hypothetical protein